MSLTTPGGAFTVILCHECGIRGNVASHKDNNLLVLKDVLKELREGRASGAAWLCFYLPRARAGRPRRLSDSV